MAQVENQVPEGAALTAEELHEIWTLLRPEDRVEGFSLLPRTEADELFFGISAQDQVELLLALRPEEQRSLLRLLPPDDTADLLQEAEPEDRTRWLGMLDQVTRHEVTALLAYDEDVAGGLMSPRFARLRPSFTVDEAIGYLRLQARLQLETLYYAYVLDEEQRLVGVTSFRSLIAAAGDRTVREVMEPDVVVVLEDQDQESVGRVFAEHDLLAIPVVDAENRMKGIITVDDVVDVVNEEATEDIHKYGGLEALEEPYLRVGWLELLRKRAGWLSVLFFGEMLTATAMARFEAQIAQAVILAIFVPLIISSGCNSGSQASTLVVRAMALGEVRLSEWWRVLRRELGTGLALGLTLGLLGFLRIVLWHAVNGSYGEHYLSLALTVATALVGVVTFGAVVGALLPFLLRRFRLDPASASAPLVATLVDVSGVLIYFGLATVLLRNTLL